MTELEQKVFLLVFQYLLIGVIILFIGFQLNKLLEKHRSRYSIITELSKQRIKVISECWASIYEWEAALRDFIRRDAQLTQQFDGDEKGYKNAALSILPSMEEKSIELSKAARNTAEKARFWIGERLYSEFQSYHNNLMDYGSAWASQDLSELKRLDSRIESSKDDLSRNLDKL